MTLHLDHIARLNLYALIGSQKANLEESRVWWKVLDRIELNDVEKTSIGYMTQQVNGMQQVGWEIGKSLPPKDIELSADERSRIERLLKEWPGFLCQADRLWLEPLMAQLDNGAK